MTRLTLIFFILSLINISNAQGLKIFGEAKPGGVIIGCAPEAKTVKLDDLILQFDSIGIFICGFDRDEKGSHTITVEYLNGNIESMELILADREYEIQKINNMASKYVTPPKKELPRIERERKVLQLARKEIGNDNNSFFMSGFVLPVIGGRVTGVFGSQRVLNSVPKSPHNGHDIAAPQGTPIYSTADGIVRIAGDDFYYNGNFVLLDHGQGLSTIYIHMSKTSVKKGDFVKKGDKIGEIGSTGRATGAHLHWGTLWFNKRIDPLSLLELNNYKIFH